ncbi:MAG: type II toxin-antitoxin system RelE/ParE family toxin [Candidatus Marinimicrobia bacterium]|nr:type II toxin-antitoxin system RelE/ParE family toxin [Candidatus Neomarinimicrobiota bacterium]
MRIEYHPAIEHKLREIIRFYNECYQGLGAEFLDEFERQILRISSNPTQWMVIEEDIRRSLMKRFPFVIYFRAVKNDVLRVTIVKHQRRHPDYGRTRK